MLIEYMIEKVPAPVVAGSKVFPLMPVPEKTPPVVVGLNETAASFTQTEVGNPVNAKEHEQYLLIYYRGTLIESHIKITNNLTVQSTKPEHLKPWQDTLLPTSAYRTAAKRIGEHCDRLIYTILQKGQGVVDNKNIWAIINLQKEYCKKAVNESCEFAFATNTISYRGVATYLRLKYKKQSTA